MSVLPLDRGRAFHRRFVERRHTTLLVAIVALFAVRPLIGDIGIGPVVFSVAFLALMLVALYLIQVDDRRSSGRCPPVSGCSSP